MKFINKLKIKFFQFLIKRRCKKYKKELDNLIIKRENDFSSVEKDINSFWFVK